LENVCVATGIGERLREARVLRGLDLDEIADRTKIRVPFLRALEEERWDQLPGPAYVRAFLRTYADALGLDADLVVDEYMAAESHEPEPEVAQAPPLGGADRRRPRVPALPAGLPRPGWPAIAGIAVVALVGILLVIGLVGGSDDGEAPAPAEDQSPASSGDGGERSAREERPSRVTLSLTTTGTVWVCVVDEDEQPVVEGVTLAAGEEAGPFRGRAFDVGLGNGAVEMEANGKRVEIPTAANPVGYRFTPERTVELTPEERPTCS
jgi:cytoskeleton protein RodZ